jgi:anti-sigma regulatory factor (Ser/Thr protein kinase)
MEQVVVPVTESSQIAEARRAGTVLATRLGYDDTQAAELAIVITELATNLVKHAHGGEILLRSLQTGSAVGIEVLSLDRGPGIADVGRALRDGYSTAGSPGNGLGAVMRLASQFDLYTHPGGSAIVARIWRSAPPVPHPCPATLLSGITVPRPGEDACGDAWACVATARGHTVLVVDGLGHGRDAAHAANAAVEGLYAQPESKPADLLQALHARLRPTRGAAALVFAVDRYAAQIDYAGVGNISGVLLSNGSQRHLVSVNGIVGHQLRRLHPQALPWPPHALVVLHTDGLATHWNLSSYPGLSARDPSLIAAVLYRDFKRGRDDTAVVVGKAEPT